MRLNENLLKTLPEQTEEYIHTRFNIEAGYKWGSGMPQNQTEAFNEEIKQLFTTAGWTVEEGHSDSIGPTVRYGNSSLYCHPMELSGPCEQKLYPMITAILSLASTCSLQSIETLGPVYNLTDHEYRSILDHVRKDIEKDLLNAFRTKNKMEYINGCYQKINDVAMRYRIPTLNSYIGISSSDTQITYTTQVFDDLLQNGKILRKENNRGTAMYRSITGEELLEKARKEATALSTQMHKSKQTASKPTNHLRT